MLLPIKHINMQSLYVKFPLLHSKNDVVKFSNDNEVLKTANIYYTHTKQPEAVQTVPDDFIYLYLLHWTEYLFHTLAPYYENS